MRRLIGLFVLLLCCVLSSPVNAKPPVHFKTHKVRSGDSLSKIAKRYSVSIGDLRKLNKLSKKTFIFPGQRLNIRPIKPAPKRAAVGHNKRNRRQIATQKKSPKFSGHWTSYTVKQGDNLWRIADRHDVSMQTLIAANNLGNKPRIHPGDIIRVKKRGTQVLQGGVKLPRKGPGYRAIRPTRSYGTPGTIRLLQKVYADFQALHPESVPGVVADISTKHGGYLPPHKSHQRGVDADISYYKKNNKRMRGLEVVTPETIDIVKTWDIIRLLINTGHMNAIFMDYKLQKTLYDHLINVGYDSKLLAKILQYPRPKSKRRGLIRHSKGHHHHLHIRFDCVRTADACTPAKTPMIAKRLLPANSPGVVTAQSEKTKLSMTLEINSILNTELVRETPSQTTVGESAIRRLPAVEIRQKPATVMLVAARGAATSKRSAARQIELEPPDWFADFKVGPKPTKKEAAQLETTHSVLRTAERHLRMTRYGPQSRRTSAH